MKIIPGKWIDRSTRDSRSRKNDAADSKPQAHHQIELEALEPRMLFSAAPVDAPAPESAEDPVAEAADVQVEAPEASDQLESSSESTPISVPEAEAAPPSTGETEISAAQEVNLITVDAQSAKLNQEALEAAEVKVERREIVFVSTEVFEYETLAGNVSAGSELFLIDGTRDGISQIAEILRGQTGIDAIHLYTHGSVGVLEIGTATLNATTMTGVYADELSVIRGALSQEADLLIYGCDFAAGESGMEAAASLSSVLGADVAASTDHTGARARGGDWDLELALGSIEAATQAAESWEGLLAPGTILVPDDGGDDDETQDASDITALSVDYTNQAAGDLVVTVQIDPTVNSGSSTSNIAVIFDTNGDGNANYGFAISLGGSPAFSVEEFSLVYGKGDGFPNKVSGKTTDIGHWVSGPGWSPGPLLTTYALDTTADDPFDASQDTRVTFNIDLDDILTHWQSLGNPGATYADIQLLNATTQPSHSVTSAPKDLGISTAPPFNATDDTATTPQNTPITLNVAANDSPGLAPSSAELGTPPSNGSVVIGANGEVTYTPTGGFSGVDTFTYLIYGLDGQPRAATVTVTVTPGANNPPVAMDDGFTVDEDGSVLIDVLNNDSDVDGNPLTITEINGQVIIEGGPAVPVTNGMVSLVAGELVFTPDPDYNGPASFDYTNSDGTESASATVSGTVNPTTGVTIEQLTLGGASQVEDTPLTFAATLDEAVAGGFTVDVSTATGTASGADYGALVNQTLTFAGTAGETVSFTVIPVDDSIIENPESFTVVMSNISIAGVDISDIGTGTILDNDARPVGIWVTTDVELVANGAGGFDLVIEDVETNSPTGFASEVPEADSSDDLVIELIGGEYVIRDRGGLALGSPIVGASRGGDSEIRVPVALVTGDIVIRTGVDDDVVTVNDLGTTIPGGLLIDTENPADRFTDFDVIEYNSDTAMASGSNAEFQADTINALVDASLEATGAGTVYWNAGRNIFMDVGSTVSSESGDIDLEANLAGVAAGNFIGVRLEGADIGSASGDVSVTGRSGTTGNYNSGVLLGVDYATATSSTISTGGQIDLTGTGGGGGVHGIGVSLRGAMVESTGSAPINITGSGGAGSLFSEGVRIGIDHCEGGHQSIIDAGTGDLNITGTGGSTGNMNRGINVSNTDLSSDGGSIELNGIGGGSMMYGIGIELNTIDAATTGSGTVTLRGSGANGTLGNMGVKLAGVQGRVASEDGAILIEGTANGTTLLNHGVHLAEGIQVSATGTGAVTILGTGGAGTVLNHGVEIGTFAAVTVNDGDLTVSGTSRGSLSLNNGVKLFNSDLSASGTGNIVVAGTGSASASGVFNSGINVSGGEVSTGTGNITMTGVGGTGSTYNEGVRVVGASLRSTGGGELDLTGTANGATTGVYNNGVYLQSVTLDSTGSIGVTGAAGGGTLFNHGIFMQGISAPGSTPATMGTAGGGNLSEDEKGDFFP